MSCPRSGPRLASSGPELLTLRARPLRIVLVGNPNVGKSVVFSRLTGRYATVSNYPGTTVSITSARTVVGAEVCDLVDTPGVNALAGALTEDEEITRRLVAGDGADLIVQVADARNLRRALHLTAHLAAFGKPMVLVLNMIDEARAHGVDVNAPRLATHLGIPVVETVAIEGRGMPELRSALVRAAVADVPALAPADVPRWAHETAQQFRRVRPRATARLQETLGRLTRDPLAGLPILAVVLYALYLFVGDFGAQTLVGWLEDGLFGGLVNPAATMAVDRLFVPPFARDFLVGEYGLITMGLTYAIAIVLPVVTTFFLMFAVLEDSGYIPRLAIFCDRTFRAMGLNGKAVLPMVLGLGCDTMATMTTRILGTPKERLIAILLLALGIPCSAQLATILGILGGISVVALLTLFAVVMAQMVFVGFCAARVVPGDRSPFILELPPIRLPQWRNVLIKTIWRVRWYLGEAVPLFLVGTALLFVLDRIGALAVLTRAGRPIVTSLLGLPAETAQVFVMGFLRRDYGAAGLFTLAQSGALSGAQAVVALTVMTLFVPCVANLLMIVRERGWQVALAILGVVTPIAVLTGAGLNGVFRIFGVAF